MPYLLVKDAKLECDHGGGKKVEQAGQGLVTIEGRPVLVEGDPRSKPIAGCPNLGATIKPCTSTLKETKGDSEFIRIEDKPVCLDTVTGLTDGTPPGMVNYRVKDPGQKFVSGEC
jgi:hypothetical protein